MIAFRAFPPHFDPRIRGGRANAGKEYTHTMPTYTYECKKCEASFDLFHAISAKPRVKCPECGGAARKLLGTGAGLIFKGSGFYETDYKRAGNGNGKSATNGSESKSESKSDSKSTKSESSASSSAKSD